MNASVPHLCNALTARIKWNSKALININALECLSFYSTPVVQRSSPWKKKSGICLPQKMQRLRSWKSKIRVSENKWTSYKLWRKQKKRSWTKYHRQLYKNLFQPARTMRSHGRTTSAWSQIVCFASKHAPSQNSPGVKDSRISREYAAIHLTVRLLCSISNLPSSWKQSKSSLRLFKARLSLSMWSLMTLFCRSRARFRIKWAPILTNTA